MIERKGRGLGVALCPSNLVRGLNRKCELLLFCLNREIVHLNQGAHGQALKPQKNRSLSVLVVYHKYAEDCFA